MKKINFILPNGSGKPVGGYKVVFEYANRLKKDGYEVTIVLPATLLWSEKNMYYKLRSIFKYLYFKINFKRYLPYSWFDLDKKILIIWVPSLEEKYIPDAEYTIATACETAEYLKKYSIKKGKKLYLIQHFENWYFSKERVLETWKYPFKKIVIAQWLLEVSNSIGEKSELIYNGLDFEKFNLDIPIKYKKSTKVIMMYHESKWKGSEIGLEALENVKKIIPNLEVTLFGVSKKPENLPKYIQYYISPSQKLLRKLYNESAIYIGTSYGEGWGLTVSEAMQCGCAIACTNVNGYNEMVINNKTGLLSPSGDSEALSKNIIELIKNKNLRIKLAKSGNNFIQDFTWEKAYSKLKNILENY